MALFTDTEAQNLGVSDSASFTSIPGATVAENLGVSDSLRSVVRFGALISDLIQFGGGATIQANYHVVMNELFLLRPSVAHGIVALVLDGFTVTEALSCALGTFVAESLGIADRFTALSRSKLSLHDQMAAHELLRMFLGGFITEPFGFVEALAVTPRWSRIASEHMAVHDALTPTLVLRVVCADNIDMDDETALQAIYRASVWDRVRMTMAFLDPGGGFTSWAINTRTGAVTEYENFVFNSFAQMGNHFLGASPGGLYVLDGSLDDTTSIVARVKSGSAQFSGSRFTSIDAIYLGCRVSDSGRDWVLKLHAGDGRTYVYGFRPLNRRTTKIFVGKGLRARYFSWELITAGEDFDLDDIEFVPIGAHRRT